MIDAQLHTLIDLLTFAVLAAGVIGLRKIHNRNGSVGSAVETLREQNSAAHGTIYARIDALRCADHGERLAVVETKLEE